MNVYALRKKGTDKYLPMRRKNRGYSHDEPTDQKPPRLHFTLKSAQNTLTAWLMGCWQNETTTSGYFGEDVDVYPVPMAPPTERKREDMEIVKFDLTEIVK